MNKIVLFLAVASVSAVVVGAVKLNNSDNKSSGFTVGKAITTVKCSDNIVVKNVDNLPSFNSVSVSVINANYVATNGNYRVELKTSDNAVDYIVCKVVDGELTLGLQNNVSYENGQFSATVYGPGNLSRVTLSPTAKFATTELTVKDFTLKVDGASTFSSESITATGKLELIASTSSTVKTGNLKASTVAVKSESASKIEVNDATAKEVNLSQSTSSRISVG